MCEKMKAKAYMPGNIESTLQASVCTWKEWTAAALSSSKLSRQQTPTNDPSLFVEVPPQSVPERGIIEPWNHQTIKVYQISPTHLPCPYSPINFGDETPKQLGKDNGFSTSSVSPSSSTGPPDNILDFHASSSSTLHKTERAERGIGRSFGDRPEIDGHLQCSNSLDNLRQMVATNQSREKSRSRSRGEGHSASPGDATSISIDSAISHPPPQPMRILPWQSPLWVQQPAAQRQAACESVHFAALC